MDKLDSTIDKINGIISDGVFEDWEDPLLDAIAYMTDLKELKEKKQVKNIKIFNNGCGVGECPVCTRYLSIIWKCCPECGQALKWDGDGD